MPDHDPFDLSHFDAPASAGEPAPAGEPVPGSESARASVPHAAPPSPPAYLDGLNPPQRQAIEALDGPVLVLAGAGTGKTRVLTTRIAHLIATGRAGPGQILAVTFTNKAAREMTERVEALLGRPVGGMAIGTFHAICARIMRGVYGATPGAGLVGLDRNFTILDPDDQIRLLKQLMAAEGVDEKRWPARALAGLIDRWKNKALTPDRLPEAEAHGFANGVGGRLYRQYQDRLKTLNACDFGDLLLHMITVFQTHADVLGDYHRRFRYLLVDEYQDTNVAQYLWLRLLAQDSKNICCVGDDDQSIYGWRGAEVGNILRFERDFPGAEVIRLEQNYRSTGNILGAASGLIAANEGRMGKTLWTEAGAGDAVVVRGVWDAEEEARQIGDEIEDLQREGLALDRVAVLVRAGFQTREFEDRFITLGLPYRVVGGPRFYERREIRDAMAYFRLLIQPSDDLALERIINVPRRGIGKATLQALNAAARAEGVPLMVAIDRQLRAGAVKGRARTALTQLLTDFARWRDLLDAGEHRHTEVAEIVLDESGYLAMWQADTSVEAPGRIENLQELIQAMAEFDNLAGFLEHIALVMDNDRQADGAAVTIMTLHGAKGLEFDTVFLPGWEEGVFPNQRAIDESGLKGLEEERRLAYVGITRAKRRARIYHAGNRQVFGKWQSQIPSRFLDELPEDHVEMAADTGLYGAQGGMAWGRSYEAGAWGRMDDGGGGAGTGHGDAGRHAGPGWQRMARREARANPFDRDQKPAARGATLDLRARKVTVQDNAAATYDAGDRVFSDKFGYGSVTGTDGNKVTVAFDKAGEKRLVASYVRPADQA
ncbi:DNA helicase II [Rhodothalassium salexigens]|uniref:ATP-dependent helicase n=1 Tax=Rhodothalassium salexigens TaxID=1086 RepID=UPI0019126E04|nr:UvrD-helicase domain-containing protein [Rhodothalassium salexigens]MBK5919717.1 DNA helicase II [Rhodothalassium salexigens]